jgi:cell division protein FtsL
MTFISSPHSNRLNIILGMLILLTVLLAANLVVVYNRLVNADHDIQDLGEQVRNSQTANAELKEEIYGIFSSDALDALATDRSLVRERNPEYLEIPHRWFLASFY